MNDLKETSSSACDVALCCETAIMTKTFCTLSSHSILTASLLGELTLLQERKMLWEGMFLAASPDGSGVFCDSRVLALRHPKSRNAQSLRPDLYSPGTVAETTLFSYRRCLELMLTHVSHRGPVCQLMVASHNEESVHQATKRYEVGPSLPLPHSNARDR